jgi:hypothetical protein
MPFCKLCGKNKLAIQVKIIYLDDKFSRYEFCCLGICYYILKDLK